MAKKGNKSVGKVSNGGRQRANVAHAAKRQAKFAAKRENGTAYEYKPNPYEKGTYEWRRERAERAEKNISHKTHYAKMRSIFAKLDNQIAEDKKRMKFMRKKMA